MPDDGGAEQGRPPSSGAPIRMRDVARQAGVSTMTVSRALSSPGTVSDAVRRRVEEAVRQIGYVPNRLAGNLSSSRSNVVGMIVPSLENSLFSSTIQGIATALRHSGHQLMVGDCGYSLEAEEALVTALLEQRVAGLVLHNTSHTGRTRLLLGRAGIPVVETGTLTVDPLDMVVSYSNEEAARAMTQHLLRLGYRRIGFICLPILNNDRSVARQRGYLAALRAAGQPLDTALMLEMPGGLASGAEAVVRLVEGAGVDAVFFAGDVLATGALFECQRRGWAVPGRVAIASFDDLELLSHTVPTITTLRLPRLEIGRRSAQVLLDRIQGRSAGPVTVDLRFEIIQRGST